MAAALGGRVAGRAASRGPGRRRAGTQGGRAGSAAPRGLGGGLAERELRELLLLLALPGPRAAPAPSSSLSPSLSWAWPCVVSDLSGSCVLDCRERLAVACGAAAGRAESETPEADALGSSASPPYPPIPEGPRSRGPPPLPAPPPTVLVLCPVASCLSLPCDMGAEPPAPVSALHVGRRRGERHGPRGPVSHRNGTALPEMLHTHPPRPGIRALGSSLGDRAGEL